MSLLRNHPTAKNPRRTAGRELTLPAAASAVRSRRTAGRKATTLVALAAAVLGTAAVASAQPHVRPQQPTWDQWANAHLQPHTGTRYDTNKDGVYDRVEYDRNRDGRVDALLLDSNGDGRYDTAQLDTDFNGVIDTTLAMAASFNLNSRVPGFSIVSTDRDGDGQIDTSLFDADGDGTHETDFTPILAAHLQNLAARLNAAVAAENEAARRRNDRAVDRIVSEGIMTRDALRQRERQAEAHDKEMARLDEVARGNRARIDEGAANRRAQQAAMEKAAAERRAQAAASQQAASRAAAAQAQADAARAAARAAESRSRR